MPVLLITLASCSVESRKESSDYPEWEYTKIKKELAAGWNTWDTRSVFTQVWSEDKVGIRMSFVDAAGKEFARKSNKLLMKDWLARDYFPFGMGISNSA